MLRKSIAFLLLLAFMAMTFSRAIILTSFLSNRNYIARVLCENRSRPVIHCGGTCYLSKKLKAEDGKDKENTESRGQIKFELVSAYNTVQILQPEGLLSTVSYCDFPENTLLEFHPTLLRPPRA